MNRAERIYRLHALLQEKPRSLVKLMEELKVSRATLVRDLGYMKDFMGAPIDRATNGYRYRITEPKFELPGLWLNESELHALQIPYSDVRELLMDILKYGPKVEVIAPKNLREMVAERLRAG
ncbi:MAG: WYL domain-containing protein [Chromatiaceae bacterium]|nr:WYL domain-containing protein [Chromatiaceae bacterium]